MNRESDEKRRQRHPRRDETESGGLRQSEANQTPPSKAATLGPPNPRRVLRTSAAAAYVGLAPSTMAKMRLRGDGPSYSKAGPRIVVYRRRDLDDWLDGRRRKSTSESPASPG